MNGFVAERDGTLLLALYIQPGAKKNGLSGRHGDALKIRLAAPPVDGKANAALLAFLAQWLQIPKSALSLKSGHSTRRKIVRVTDIEADTLARRIAESLRE